MRSIPSQCKSPTRNLENYWPIFWPVGKRLNRIFTDRNRALCTDLRSACCSRSRERNIRQISTRRRRASDLPISPAVGLELHRLCPDSTICNHNQSEKKSSNETKIARLFNFTTVRFQDPLIRAVVSTSQWCT